MDFIRRVLKERVGNFNQEEERERNQGTERISTRSRI